jgi:hypothetical protein
LGPVNVTTALDGSKPLPEITNVNACPAIAEDGAIAVTWGLTLSETLFDAAPPDPFCTTTENVPAPRVIGPLNCVAVLAVREPFAIVHGVVEQPGPAMEMIAVAGSKPLPVTVSVNAC